MRGLPKEKQMEIEEKRDEYFKKLPRDISRKIQMDEEAAYSVTEMDLADETSRYIIRKLSRQGSATITDAAACIGGNTLNFAKHFAHVNSVEIDPMRAEFLRNNVKL